MQLSELGDLGIVESEEYLYQLNAAGMSVGTDGQAPLVRLSRRLADERRRWRGERTSYLTELRHLTSAAGAPRDRSERAATAAYAAGIAALRAGRYGRFRLHMREAVREGGPMADKARQRLRLSAVAPALRALYAWRVRGTPLEHVKPIPAAARLPEWVSRHATDLRVRSERPV